MGNNDLRNLEIEETRENRVKDSWFEAWMRGNRLFPQVLFGIYGEMVNTILEDTSEIIDISFSELSDEQIQSAIDAIDRSHTAYEIRLRADQTLMEKDREIIAPSKKQIYEAWNRIKNGLFYILNEFSGDVKKLDELKDLVKQIHDLINEREIQSMAKAYRNKLTDPLAREVAKETFIREASAYVVPIIAKKSFSCRYLSPAEVMNLLRKLGFSTNR